MHRRLRYREFERAGRRISFTAMVTRLEADLAGALTLGMKYGTNLENGVIKFKRLRECHVQGGPGGEVRWL
jgi:hypothetical protein